MKAINFLINNFDEWPYFLERESLPLDNKSEERLMKNPVNWRKTLFGTQSKKGAQSNSVIVSLVEFCKIYDVNPWKYFKDIILSKHGKSRDVSNRPR